VIKNWRIGVVLLVIRNWLFALTNKQFSKNGANVSQYPVLLYKILKVVYQKVIKNKRKDIFLEKMKIKAAKNNCIGSYC
jgi:hypothetical protein